MISIPQIVVESLASYKAPVGSKDMCPAADQVVPLLPQESQASRLSFVQLSPNQARADFDAMGVFAV